jgi:glycosyltransferase involved in cell wall biosynthesis
LHVVPTFYPAVCYGGPIYSVRALCNSLLSLDCDVRVLTTDANGPKRRLSESQKRDSAVRNLNVDYCRRYGSGMVSPELLRRIRSRIEWCDVVHLTGVYDFTTFPVLAACRLEDKPVVWSPRGGLQRWTGSRNTHWKHLWESVCRSLAPRRLALHVTSVEEAAESDARLGNGEIHVVPNGVDIPDSAATEPTGERLELLFVGRLDPKKGLENLFTACSLISRGSPSFPWRLTVAGAGVQSYQDRLREVAAQLGISDGVHFSGHLDGEAKRRAYAGCHAVVVPSHTENFGLVVAESLAHGRPVIASKGTPWAGIEGRGCGYWISNDPESLCNGIRRIRTAERTAMGMAGRSWMKSDFSWQRRAAECRDVYYGLVDP